MEIKSIEIHEIGEIKRSKYHVFPETISKVEIILKRDEFDTYELFNQIVESVISFNLDEHFDMGESLFRKLEIEKYYRIEYIQNSGRFKITKTEKIKNTKTIDL